jgi:competence protein ComEA
LAWLERNQLLVLGLAGLLLLSGLIFRDITRNSPPALVLNDTRAAEESVVVHVSGAVAAPGIYELARGARIQDAVVAAGGALPQADVDAINLARRVRDGEKVAVPTADSVVSEVAAATAVPTLGPGVKLDINTATAAELIQLPGIGVAYSQRIVDSRDADGPYVVIEDLTARRVIPEATFELIRDRVSVSAP